MHNPVLLEETISSLVTKPDGVYVDCTLGGGGHLSRLLEQLDKDAKIIAIDKDETIMKETRQKFAQFKNISFVYDDFKNLQQILDKLSTPMVDGIMIDLGVSSFQLDDKERGFSFHNQAVLDMRMDRGQEITAKDMVNQYSEEELSKIIFTYGEERFARSIAKKIVEYRTKREIETTLELVEIIKTAIPARFKKEKHPARKTFQALRIAVNGELDSLTEVLPQAVDSLKTGGRLCIITFHSLEDRIVKQFILEKSRNCICPASFPVCTCNHKADLRIITRKPILPDDDELSENTRARSAKLRVAERI
ncbi:MAG: 16S rRNA (cytosine(1402)-N(4))-methyltransferase RsmH [Syntrophomonadaceae bacterium]|jgi:16S rRNA (cytosine1402-N4)-methyltransferase|nr:16S rRNA (cytosine(1402)-N(4))-methyltransferase RsmH [Syntrophomonadaceae bacterium]